MAESPSHKLGQKIGFLIEAVVKSQIEIFCTQKDFYLDFQGNERPARKGQKVAWEDHYGNIHDLDFVIEKDGTSEKIGTPVGFIEVAWRRYTKHSRNKAQEIQGAIMPLVEKYKWNNPFVGVVVAGDFTENSINQLKSLGFSVLYFPYNTIIEAFRKEGVNVAFDEKTSDADFQKYLRVLDKCSRVKIDRIQKQLFCSHKKAIQDFLQTLELKLSKVIEKIIIIPLYGNTSEFCSIKQALSFISQYSENKSSGKFRKFEILVRFSNQDKIEASFADKLATQDFLRYLSTTYVSG